MKWSSSKPTDPSPDAYPRASLKQTRTVLRSRLRRWIVGPLWVLLLVPAGGYYYFTRPAVLIRFAERYLTSLTNGVVEIEQASFSVFEGVHLTKVTIRTAGVASEPFGQTPILSCDSLALKHDPVAALIGRLEIHQISATGTHITLISDPQTGKMNLSALLGERQGSKSLFDRGQVPAHRPRIQLPNTRFTFCKLVNGKPRVHQQAAIDLWAVQRRTGTPVYDIIWRDPTSATQTGAAKLNFENGSFEFEAGSRPPWLPVEFAIAAIPITNRDLGQWIKLLGIQGNFRVEDLAIGSAAGRLGARGRITLKGASLSVPINLQQEQLRAEERIFAVTDVEGSIAVTADTVHAEFEGDLHGRRCRARLEVSDVPRELTRFSQAAWDLEISCDDFELLRDDVALYPVEAQTIAVWPAIKRFYENFDPHGRVRLSCRVRKSAGREAQPSIVHARFEALDCDGRYRHFPYRLSDVTGVVKITSDGSLHFENLIGRHGTAVVTINGETKGHTASAGLHYTVTARNIALDRDLYLALPPAHRETWDLFELSGTVNIVAHVEREAATTSPPPKVQVVVEGDLLYGRVRYAKFPYLVENLTGRFNIDDGITLQNVRGTQDEMEVTINGYSRRTHDGSRLIDLRFAGTRLPFAGQLNQAVSPRVREVLGALNLAGWVDFTGHVYRTAEMDFTSYEFEATALDTDLVYDRVPYPLSNCSAKIHITPKRVVIRDFLGRHAGTVVTATADMRLDPQHTVATVLVESKDVELDDALWRALPGAFSKAAQRFSPKGAVDVKLEYRTGEAEGGVRDSFKAEVTAKGNHARFESFPLPLSNVNGRITITNDSVRLADLTADCDGAAVTLDGRVNFGPEKFDAELRITAHNLDFSPSLRYASPFELRTLLDQAAPSGKLDVEIEHLNISGRGSDQPLTWTTACRARLRGINLDAGLRLRNVVGRLQFQGASGENATPMLLQAHMTLDSAEIHDTPCTEITGQVVYDQALRLFALRNVRTKICNGSASGAAVVYLGADPPQYDAVCRLEDLQLVPLLEHRRLARQGHSAPIMGRLNATAAIQGRMGLADHRRAWGRVEIGDAQLYKLPLMLGILHVINLTAPETGAFQDCEFRFNVQGNEMRLHDIALHGSAVSLVGSGFMSVDSEELDLDLLVSSPRRGLRIPLLTDVIEGAARELFDVRVTGPLADPQISTRPLSGVRRIVRWLAKSGKAED